MGLQCRKLQAANCTGWVNKEEVSIGIFSTNPSGTGPFLGGGEQQTLSDAETAERFKAIPCFAWKAAGCAHVFHKNDEILSSPAAPKELEARPTGRPVKHQQPRATAPGVLAELTGEVPGIRWRRLTRLESLWKLGER